MLRSGPARAALLVIGAYALFFTWLFARPIVEHAYLAEADLFDSFLPRFLAGFSPWSSYEYAGYLYAAQSDHFPFYPLSLLFGRLFGSWTGFIISAYVVAAAGTYAYVYSLTRSRLASAFAGLAYALSEAMMERIAHPNIVHASAWLPLIMLSVDGLRGPHWLEIERLTVIDETGQQFPQRMPDFIVHDEQRWRSLPFFSTSETTDRARDEAVEGERDCRRRLPRAERELVSQLAGAPRRPACADPPRKRLTAGRGCSRGSPHGHLRIHLRAFQAGAVISALTLLVLAFVVWHDVRAAATRPL